MLSFANLNPIQNINERRPRDKPSRPDSAASCMAACNRTAKEPLASTSPPPPSLTPKTKNRPFKSGGGHALSTRHLDRFSARWAAFTTTKNAASLSPSVVATFRNLDPPPFACSSVEKGRLSFVAKKTRGRGGGGEGQETRNGSTYLPRILKRQSWRRLKIQAYKPTHDAKTAVGYARRESRENARNTMIGHYCHQWEQAKAATASYKIRNRTKKRHFR